MVQLLPTSPEEAEGWVYGISLIDHTGTPLHTAPPRPPPLCPGPQVKRYNCRGLVSLDPYLLASFSWSSCGSPVSCYPRLTLWTHFTLERKKRNKRGIRACGAGPSLQVDSIPGHKGRLLDHPRSFPSGLLWETGRVMRSCER